MVTSKRVGSQAGTTLLEVMVAIAIASIALVSFVTLVITSLDMENHARKITEATLIADEKLKEIERAGYPEPGRSEGLVSEQDPSGYSYALVVTDTPIQNVRQVDIEVYWDKKRGSVELTTYIAKQ
ncbi:MAG: type II secretion system protein [Syntrophorhabdales bacterium]|jgi:general secretion pathway protein I